MIRTLLALFFVAATAKALEVPPSPNRWFTDRAGVVPAAQAEALNRKLADFEQQSGAQFIIYTFPSLEGEAVEDFTIRAVERWKVGQKKYDNGLVLFVFVKERTVRIEVAYGLEGVITDAYASRVIREYIAPHFRGGDYAAGLNAAADAIIAKIRKEEPPVPPLVPRGQPAQQPASFNFPSVLFLIILFVVIFFILPRTGCRGCFWPMFFFPGGGGGTTFGGGGFGGGGFGGGGFSGGGGRFGGGGATGGW